MVKFIKNIVTCGLALLLVLGLTPATDVNASTGVIYPEKTMEEIAAEFGYSFADIMADYENNVYLHDWLACLANSNATTPSEHSNGDVVYDCTDTLRVNYEGEYAPAGQLLDWSKVQVFLNDVYLGNMDEYGEFYNGEVYVGVEIPYHYAKEGHNAVWIFSNLTETFGQSYAFSLHYIGYDPSKPLPLQEVTLYEQTIPEAYCTVKFTYEGVGAVTDFTKVKVYWNDVLLGNLDAAGNFVHGILSCTNNNISFNYADPTTGGSIIGTWSYIF